MTVPPSRHGGFSRRQFFGLAALLAGVAALPSSNHHERVSHESYEQMCIPHDIPRQAVIGDCYITTRGTYAGWERPGVPPVVAV
jgi:hypothetical protein